MDKYLDLFKSVCITVDKNKLSLEYVPYTESQFVRGFPAILSKMDVSLADELLAVSVKDKEEFTRMARGIFHKLKSLHNIAEEVTSVAYELPNPQDLELVCDAVTGKEFVVDLSGNKLTGYHPNAFWASFTGAERKEIEQKTRKSVASVIFNPQDHRAYYSEEGFTYLNKYTEPVWREKEGTSEPPVLFLELLDHLFSKDKDQIHFVLNWLFRLLTTRNETALVLNGFKGVGKNILYAVCKAITGPEYCAEAPKKFGVKEFNDILRDRILILLDEHEIKKEKYNFLKASFNEWQTIEAKGQAVKSTERVYTNFMIFHNSPADMYLENAERRFSVMDITEIPLNEVWDHSKIERFYKDLEDPKSQLIKNIGNYIFEYGSQFEQNPFELYLGEKYKEIVDCHVDILIHSILDLIEKDLISHEGYIPGDAINKNCFKLLGSKRATKGEKARSMVREYKFKGKYSLGEVDTNTMPWRLKVNPEVIELVTT